MSGARIVDLFSSIFFRDLGQTKQKSMQAELDHRTGVEPEDTAFVLVIASITDGILSNLQRKCSR